MSDTPTREPLPEIWLSDPNGTHLIVTLDYGTVVDTVSVAVPHDEMIERAAREAIRQWAENDEDYEPGADDLAIAEAMLWAALGVDDV
jgi:hypothetical protein